MREFMYKIAVYTLVNGGHACEL